MGVFYRTPQCPLVSKLVGQQAVVSSLANPLNLGIMPEVSHVVPCDDARTCDFDQDKWNDGILQQQRILDEAVQDLSPEEKVKWLKEEKNLRSGYTIVDDPRYILRPEAIESVFILYRLTGDSQLMEVGWRMFEAIERNTATVYGNAAIQDVTVLPPDSPRKIDRMESFWLAETLKYFYLLYSEPELVSLDTFVL